MSYSPNGRCNHSVKAFSMATTIVEEEPSPEPGGASQYVVIRNDNGRLLWNWLTTRLYTAWCKERREPFVANSAAAGARNSSPISRAENPTLPSSNVSICAYAYRSIVAFSTEPP